MFERFTRDGRTAVVNAQASARESGSLRIDSLHLLAGLVRTPSGPVRSLLIGCDVAPDELTSELERVRRRGGVSDSDAAALGDFGIDVEQIVERVEGIYGEGVLASGTRRTRRGHIPFSPDAKRTLEQSLRQALETGDKHIGAEHLLLALVATTGPAADVLAKRGVDQAAIWRVLHQRKAG